MRILLVDDHALVRDGLRLVLERLTPIPEVREASTFAQALAALSTERFDLLLLDYYLPDGIAERDIVEIARVAPDTPVVLVTCECEPRIVRGLLAAGARGLVPKHSTADVMLAALGLVISGGTYVPPEALEPVGREASAPTLTERQRTVLRLLVKGSSNKEIATALGTSESTIRVHVSAILRALGAENRTQACQMAMLQGLVPKERR